MDELINEFVSAMIEEGLGPAHPSDIKADDKRRDYQLSGDPKSKKKGFYKLRVVGDFACGFFGDYRQGDFHSWHSNAPRRYTAEERRAFALKAEAERKRAEDDRKWRLLEVAQQAADDLLFLEPCTIHPYLTRKCIKAHGALVSGNDLILPMRDHERVWNYQKITPDGDKFFLLEGRKAGTWFEIDGPCETICIAEGFATGASAHEGVNCLVRVAWDCGNLPAVAIATRRQYPNAQIIICADNDPPKTNRKGDLVSAGRKAANKAAGAIGGAIVVWPEFPPGDHDELSDFNDLHCLVGLDAVRNRIQAAISGSMPEQAAGGVKARNLDSQAPSGAPIQIEDHSEPSDWMEHLITRNKEGALDARSLHNVILIMENSDEYKGVFSFNDFKGDIFKVRCPPWEDSKAFAASRVENIDLVRCEAHLEKTWDVRCGATKVAAAIDAAAHENRFHPVREYFASLEWDGQERLKTWLRHYADASGQPGAYLARVGMTWMVAAVSRVFKPGCKFDNMLVLEGAQDAGKSMLLRTIGTFGRDIEECHYTDAVNIGTIEERGSILKLQGNLVIEFPELAGFGKKDQNELKRWITLQEDEVEVKFKQRTQIFPRQFVLAGTYNPLEGDGWINDTTGGRRFWPVACGSNIRIDDLRRDREQLWAEAVDAFKGGFQLFVGKSDPVYSMMQLEQAKRVDIDVWMEPLVNVCDERTEWTTSEMLEKLGVPIGRQTKADKSRVTKIFGQIGWLYMERRIAKTSRMVWTKQKQQKLHIEEFEEEIKW
jgi:putative DNA primase/helicase